MHQISRGISTLILCFLTPSWAYAQTPEASPTPTAQEAEVEDDHRDPITHKPNRIDPDRPHVSEAPVIVGTGTLQIEAGVLTTPSRGGAESGVWGATEQKTDIRASSEERRLRRQANHPSISWDFFQAGPARVNGRRRNRKYA